MHHVTVLHDIVLAFKPELAELARTRLAISGDVIFIGNGFSADIALLEIRMDDAGCTGALGALGDGPGAGFLWAYSEIGHQVQQVVTSADDPVQSGLSQANGIEIVLLICLGQNRNLALDLGRDDAGHGVFFFGAGKNAG